MALLHFRALCVSLALIAVAVGACREESTEFVRLHPKSFSAADEAVIGDRLMAADWRNANVALLSPGDPGYRAEAAAYVDPLLQQLVDQAPVTRRDSFGWRVHLVMDTSVHAYALPGGHLVMNTGLLYALHSEAELVGVMARELSLIESGAAMGALVRLVDDNVLLGDILLDNPVAYGELIRLLPKLEYTASELAVADSLAAVLVCPSNYLHEALPEAMQRLSAKTPYREARPAGGTWIAKFNARVADCAGSDSVYVKRYREVLRRAVPEG